MTNKKYTRSNNEKLVIGVVIGAVIGFLIYWTLNIVTDYSQTLFLILVAVTIVLALLLLILTWFRNKLIRKYFGKDIEFETLLKETQETIHVVSENITNKLPVDNDKKKRISFFLPRFINYLLWSNFRNWGLKILTSFVLGLGGIVTTILVINQNKLFESQNNLIKLQNKRIEQQTHLIEADRRSSQVFIMGEVLSDLNRELEDSLNVNRELSYTLAGRIVSLSRAMRPYRYLEGDSLIKNPLSPERGQLLISLISSRIDTLSFLNEIVHSGNFDFADLRNANLVSVELSDIKLNYADLSNSNLIEAEFDGLAEFKNAKFINANLFCADFRQADLRNANFFKANLSGTEFEFANMKGVYLDSAKVNRYNWLDYIKDSLNIEGGGKLFEEYRVDSVYYNSNEPLKRPMLIKKNKE